MTELLFTSSYERLFCPIVVWVFVGNRAFLEGDKQDITKVAFLVQASLLSSCYMLQPQTCTVNWPDFPIFQGINVGWALFESESWNREGK